MKTLWNKLINAIRKLFSPKQVFLLVWPGMKAEIDKTVNDGILQDLAFDAVRTAAELGLKGDDAWKHAFAKFSAGVLGLGIELGKRFLDTILQVAYLRFRGED